MSRYLVEMPCFKGECNLNNVLGAKIDQNPEIVAVDCMDLGFIVDRNKIGNSEGCPFERMASFVTRTSMEAAAKETQNA